MELSEKTIIITGAAAARLFAAEGANLILGARRQAELDQVAGQIDKCGGHARVLAGDVTDESYNGALVEFALAEFGGLDGAFNNAGTVGDTGPVPEMDSANWNRVIATNLTGAFYAAKAQIPALQARGRGALVFTSSFVGNANGGMPGMAAYAAAKAGVVGLMQSLASDHAAQGIRVNAVLPGGTMTAMAGDDPDVHAFISDLHPMKRLATPDEIAQAALFLLSDRASFVTGSPLSADGGVTVRLI